MLQLLREGYWRDLAALFLVTALCGSLVTFGAGRLVAAYFEGALEALVGSPGEFDFIVHVRRDSEAEAHRALQDLLASISRGYTLKAGPAIAGQVHLLAGLPRAAESRPLFESLGRRLEAVPGYEGITFMVEPAVVLKDVHPALAGRLREEAEAVAGVRFAFAHGGSVWAVLESPEDAGPVRDGLVERLESLALVEVRFPEEGSQPEAQEAMEAAQQAFLSRVAAELPAAEARPLGPREAPFGEAAAALRRLIAQLEEGEELRRRLASAASLLEQAEGGAQDARVSEVIDTFRQALSEIEVLQLELERLAAQLKGAAADGEATGVLVALLLQRLFEGAAPAGAAPEPAVDVKRLEAGLDAIEEQLRRFDSLDLGEFAQSLREVERGLPVLAGEELARLQESLSRLEEAWGGSERLEVLVEGEWSAERLASLATEAFGASAQVRVEAVADVEPDARTSVMRLLGRAQGVATALISLCLLLVFLFTDCATLASYCSRRAEGTSTRRAGKSWLASGAFGAAWGGTLLLLFARAGGVSGIPVWLLVVAGAAAGFLITAAAPRISPVPAAPVEAGLSLGMSEAEIVREIVVPGGRPGLLYLLNRWRRRRPAGRERDAVPA